MSDSQASANIPTLGEKRWEEMMGDRRRPPGPEASKLTIDEVSWEEAVRRALAAGKPPPEKPRRKPRKSRARKP